MGLREDVEQSEEKFKKALECKHQHIEDRICNQLIVDDVLVKIDILKFHDLYQKNTTFPIDRLSELCLLLLDIKMQVFFILTDLSGSQRFIMNPQEENYNNLCFLSYDQSLIVKSRILFERLMNFIYLFETGNELKENSNDKSKKTVFFKFISKSRWEFLFIYKGFLDWFDDKLRTPEIHHGSVIRNYFINSQEIHSDLRNKMLGLLNLCNNTLYLNVLSILEGKKIENYYWSYSFSDENPLDLLKNQLYAPIGRRVLLIKLIKSLKFRFQHFM